MQTGLKQGAKGADVKELQRILKAAGLEIDPQEVKGSAFGPSTLAALKALQARHGLPETGEVDQDTLKLLQSMEKEAASGSLKGSSRARRRSKDAASAAASTPPQPAAPVVPIPPAPARPGGKPQGSVHGRVVDEDGQGLAATITLFSQGLRDRTALGKTKTDERGQYSLTYARPAPLNLVVKASVARPKLKIDSAVVFAAPADVEIDLTTAPDGVVRSPSAYTALSAEVQAQLGKTPFEDLQENKENHDLEFLANAVGVAFVSVAELYIAHRLVMKNKLDDATLFGIFSHGIPATLEASLGNLADTGIDDAFLAQVLADVLSHSRSMLAGALSAAITANVLPASYAAKQDTELTQLDALRVQGVGAAPYLNGIAPLKDLLAAGKVDNATQAAFTHAYAASGGDRDATWNVLHANTNLTKAQLASLDNALKVSELLGGNLPLVNDTMTHLAQGTLTRVQDLALLVQADWVARIRQVDPQAASIPPLDPNETPAQRIARFADVLANGLAAAYPTTAFIGVLTRNQYSPFKTRSELINALTAHPDFDLVKTNIDQYISENQLHLSADGMTELKSAQRLARLSSPVAGVDALMSAGFKSAQDVYFKGRAPFIAQMSSALGGEEAATAVWLRAEATYAGALTMFGRFNLSLNGIHFAAMASPEPSVDMTQLPDLQALFGSLDYCQCTDCRSVLSPAAYLVDLLHFLSKRLAQPSQMTPPTNTEPPTVLDLLLARRPDLQYVALGCQNTNVTLPYIDVVNELIEAAIAPPAPAVKTYETTGTSAERRALPQQVSHDAYDKTAAHVFPLNLPFDLNFARTSAYLNALGTSREALMRLCGTGSAAARAAAQLGLNPAMHAVINGSDTHKQWERWGFSSANPDPSSVVDPKTRQVFDPPPTDWIEAMSKVPLFLNRAGLDFAQLCQMLEVEWVTRDAVTLSLGTSNPVANVPVASCDTEIMTFTGLDAGVLDLANRFLRLWRATGLEMWELDWLLNNRTMDDAFLIFLADALALRDRLGLPLQDLLSFWQLMTTRDVTSHLGETDTSVPSTYTRVFLSPTLWQDGKSMFGGGLPPAGGAPIDFDAIKAALGLSAGDVTAVCAAAAIDAKLNLTTLTELFRHARLASLLSLTVPDLLLWITLTVTKPFGGSPSDTLEFLRRYEVLQGTGLAAHDLDYLLRDGSADQSSLTFTQATAANLLQTIRVALAKLPAAQQTTLTPEEQADLKNDETTVFVNTLATATGVSANVVAPVLEKTLALPLDPATAASLIAQASGVDPNQFPQLVAAFTRVAKAAALFKTLQPAEAEFAFLVQNATHFNWLDPSALLPDQPANPYSYESFERLLQALTLNRRQRARAPKLFDVLSGWVAALPADLTSAITDNSGALAQAMNASVPDVTTLAAALDAKAPSLDAATQPGSLADVAMLSMIGDTCDALTQFHIGAETLLQLAASPSTADSAKAALGVYQSRFDPGAWFGAVQPIEDKLREVRRDALIAYVIGQGTALPDQPLLLSTDDVFNYFLIDPEMSACMLTTRLLEASLAVQQFVQQCYLGLVDDVTINADVDRVWNDWWWMKEFRLWQANRQVFLYPENYLLPELRTDKSPFFVDLENELLQSNCDGDAVTAALENYLRKLVEVANLVVAAHCLEIRANGSRMLHVFARTRRKPWKWYYRTREVVGVASGIWSAWQPLNLDIASEQVVPVVWDRRLHLIWPIFTRISQKASTQNVPTGGDPTYPAKHFWAVEFAMSELSAGQWQAKRTYEQKFFLETEDPALAFTFRAFEDDLHNLQVQVYYNRAIGSLLLMRPVNPVTGPGTGESGITGPTAPNTGTMNPAATYSNLLVGAGKLPMPDSPLTVSERISYILFDRALIDPSQEPTAALVDNLTQTGSLTQPQSYCYSGQYLIGNYRSVPLNVLDRLSTTGQPNGVELLQQMDNARIVVQQEDPSFDWTGPFFAAEPSRTYLVSPRAPLIVFPTPPGANTLARISFRATRYTFESFYHPFAYAFLRELEIGGVDQLMNRCLQLEPEVISGRSFDFNSYRPQSQVIPPAREDVDFTGSGAYALYNWELFYHVPMFVANQLMRNQQYQDAMHWLEYVFSPTDSSTCPNLAVPDVPGKFWHTRPFYEMNSNKWLAQQIQNILTTSAAKTQQGISDPNTKSAIDDWMAHPFDPHRIARLRPGAYAKAAVMKFLDNLIAWGDSLYAQYTMEKVAQAEQLYVFADLILGPEPEQVRMRDTDLATVPDATTYATLQSGQSELDPFANELVAIENLTVAPATDLPPSDGSNTPLALPLISTLFFCIPPNEQLLAYWHTVSDRLYKIRHCLNIQGVAQPLPLYAPPISPLQLMKQGIYGAGSVNATTFTPVYRFAVYLERALELANDIRAYGALVLATLEKKDAEALAALHANQDLDIQTRLLDIKTQSSKEAQEQVTALQKQKAVIQTKYNFYNNLVQVHLNINAQEAAALSMQMKAHDRTHAASYAELSASALHLIPTFHSGGAGAGGSPYVVLAYGGTHLADSSSAFSSYLGLLASLHNASAGMDATMGGYQRRQDEWDLQKDLAEAELTQLDSQIAAANERLAIANSEVDLQKRQIVNAQAVSDFLTSKYTNAQLYDWMLTQLTTVHTQAYQLAFSLAQQAEAAYNYELGKQGTDAEPFIQYGYWDSQHKGLTAGESLLFDLRRMQAQYLTANAREIELEKHISLALTQPMALVQLLQTGTCQINLDEMLFDLDHPGHYFRRLRSVAITLPCVTGPYSGVNATLTLNSAAVRTKAPTTGYAPVSWSNMDPGAVSVTTPAGNCSISTSHGQNDAGLFEVNLRDERWLPFEGQGAVSTWTLELDPRDNTFDFSTITDVILHLRYTARSTGGNPAAVRQALQPKGERQIMLSVRNSFSNAYYNFFNPSDASAAQQILVLPLDADVLPFSNLGAPAIAAIAVYLILKEAPAAGTTIAASFGPTGGTAGALSIEQVPGSTGSGAPINALVGNTAFAGHVPPGSFTFTVPEGSVPGALGITGNGHQRLDAAKFDDIVLVVTYQVD